MEHQRGLLYRFNIGNTAKQLVQFGEEAGD